jgi:hypothetical protein
MEVLYSSEFPLLDDVVIVGANAAMILLPREMVCQSASLNAIVAT